MKLKYLITGTGRCGTLNAAHNLTKAGVVCGHESIFDLKGVDGAKKRLNGEMDIYASNISTDFRNESIWFDPLLLRADSSYMAAPFLKDEILKDVTIIHLLRDPLKVISSFIKNLGYFKTLENPWEKFICSHVPSILNFESQLERACEYYYQWNHMVAQHPTITHEIEKDINVLFEKLGVATIDNPSEERNIFSKRDKDFLLEDIPQNFREKIYEVYQC